MNKKLPSALLVIVVFGSSSAFADDKTPPQPVDQQKLKDERTQAKKIERAMRVGEPSTAPADPYGTSPMRTERGTPMVGDFNEKGQISRQPASKGKPALPTREEKRRALQNSEKLQGSFGPPAGRADAPNKALDDQPKKAPGQ